MWAQLCDWAGWEINGYTADVITLTDIYGWARQLKEESDGRRDG